MTSLLKGYRKWKQNLPASRADVSWRHRQINSRIDMIDNCLAEIAIHVADDQNILQRRINLSNQVDILFNSTVKYGPFKGLRLSKDAWWARTDRASMLLGLYELEVLSSLERIPYKYTIFIDIGAANGYYSIGVLVNNLFKKTYCFEISEVGQNLIRVNSEINGVSSRIEIFGEAKNDFYKVMPASEVQQSVLLVDIEGGEFDLFDSDLFYVFRLSVIFIELHDWAADDGATRLAKLVAKAEKYFHISEIKTTARDLSSFPELHSFSDTDRWLICSEGRPRLMTWLRLDPI